MAPDSLDRSADQIPTITPGGARIPAAGTEANGRS